VPVFIGTSGWQYDHWRGTFYPEGVAQSRWLEFYAEQFRVVELNNSFYQLPKRETFDAWAKRTPDDFVLAAKMSRYLTHVRRLKEPSEPVGRFLSHAQGLGSKLGPVLLQLPPTLRADAGLLEEVLGAFPAGVRVALEPRHDSWFLDEIAAVLSEHNAAMCLTDRKAEPVTPVWRTADWTFLRFHEGTGSPHPCYKRSTMETWVERLAESWGKKRSDLFVFFNNDPRACALRDAVVFAELLQGAGFETTRVPTRRDVRIDRG
jgi:uncharacterized protein YecE (DUF72 family)